VHVRFDVGVIQRNGGAVKCRPVLRVDVIEMHIDSLPNKTEDDIAALLKRMPLHHQTLEASIPEPLFEPRELSEFPGERTSPKSKAFSTKGFSLITSSDDRTNIAEL
jgi:hypothetical protein